MASIHQFNADDDGLGFYPGSPCLARTQLRPQDRLIANELHPEDFVALREQFFRDRQTSVLNQDAWSVLKSTLPPKERRAVVLVDPPFEQAGEFGRLADGLVAACRRFATGIYVLWYPMKDESAVFAFTSRIIETGLPRLLHASLQVRKPGPGQHRAGALFGSGLIIHNPPFGLESALQTLLPALAQILAQDTHGQAHISWLRGES